MFKELSILYIKQAMAAFMIAALSSTTLYAQASPSVETEETIDEVVPYPFEMKKSASEAEAPADKSPFEHDIQLITPEKLREKMAEQGIRELPKTPTKTPAKTAAVGVDDKEVKDQAAKVDAQKEDVKGAAGEKSLTPAATDAPASTDAEIDAALGDISKDLEELLLSTEEFLNEGMMGIRKDPKEVLKEGTVKAAKEDKKDLPSEPPAEPQPEAQPQPEAVVEPIAPAAPIPDQPTSGKPQFSISVTDKHGKKSMDSKESKDSPPESHKESSGESNKISGAEPEVEESMEQPISVSPDKELPNSESLKPEEPIAAKKKSIIVESPKIKTKVVRQTPEIPFRPSYPVAEPTPLPPPVDLSLEPPAPIFIPPVPTASASELSPATRDTFRIIESGIAAKGKPKGQMTINISKDDFETGLGTVDPEKNREGIGIKVKNDSAGSASERQVLGEAFSALMSGQYEASIALYKQALAINNKNQDALLGLATAYQKSRMLPQARAVYNQLLTLYPNNQKAINNFVVLASEESPTEALNELLRLEKTNPGYSPVVAQIGMIYDRMNQPQQAIQYLRRALSISPQNMAYRYNLAVLLDKNGDYQNAIQLYKQLIDASARGVQIPAAARQLQERLTFLRSK